MSYWKLLYSLILTFMRLVAKLLGYAFIPFQLLSIYANAKLYIAAPGVALSRRKRHLRKFWNKERNSLRVSFLKYVVIKNLRYRASPNITLNIYR